MSRCDRCRDPLEDWEVEDIDGLCESCDNQLEYCEICQQRVNVDQNECRHIYVDGDGELRGCGAYSEDGHAEERASLHMLLDALGLRDAMAIERAIDDRQFNVRYWDGMICAHLECYVGQFGAHGPSDQWGQHQENWNLSRDIGERIEEAIEDDERTRLGAQWLWTLQAAGEDTTEADCKLTIAWIRAWPPLAAKTSAFRSASNAQLRRAA